MTHQHGATREPASALVLFPASAALGTLIGMPEPDLEARLAMLEARVDELAEQVQQARAAREDAAAARHLAAANDRDVSEIRTELRDFRQATTTSFSAMRDDLADLGGDFADLRGETGTGFTEMRGKFDQTAAGQAQIVELLSTLIGQRDQGDQ